MAAIKSKDTTPEIIFRKKLWGKNVRYRKHIKVFGKPDIAIKKYKIAIFIDGDFWHGNNWRLRGLLSLDDELKTYSDFWKLKIQKNIKRDEEVNMYLRSQGWSVLRFWQSEIESNLDGCVDIALKAIQSKRYDPKK